MSYENNYDDNYVPTDLMAANASAVERSSFITKTYLHLAGAIGVFAALEAVWLNIPGIENLVRGMLVNRFAWFGVLAAFMFVAWIADSWSRNTVSRSTQYFGLGLYIFAESIIFIPLLYLAQTFYPGAIFMATWTTGALLLLLTAVVFITRMDFSFLRPLLIFGSLAALGFIVVGICFNFAFGPIFTYLMIALACCYILYDTSNIMLNYRTDQYVAASLALFASVALLFWYILQLYLSSNRN